MPPQRTVPDKTCGWAIWRSKLAKPQPPDVGCRVTFRPQNMERATTPTTCCTRVCAAKLYSAMHPSKMGRCGAAAVARRARARAERTTKREFGELSEREITLFNRAMRIGYDRGYNRGYKLRLAAAAAQREAAEAGDGQQTAAFQ